MDMVFSLRLLLSFAAIAVVAGIIAAWGLPGSVLVFAVLVAAAAVSYTLLRSVLKPVGEITVAINEIATGPTLRAISIGHAPPEIESLVDAFNRMQETIRERRRANQEKLMRSDRLAVLGQLAAGVAHEINNPLGSILLLTKLLMEQPAGDGQARENLERIEKETMRCHAIVRSLLDFSRQSEPKIEHVEVNQLVDSALKFFEKQSYFRNIEVVRRYADGIPAIQADQLQLQQVLMNMIINAVDAMNGKGVLTLETAEAASGASVEISLSDTGCGIPAENLDRIFDPFFTTKEVGRGTGLGLSVSYGIVQAHNGDISVVSSPGSGSRFTVTLPKSRESA